MTVLEQHAHAVQGVGMTKLHHDCASAELVAGIAELPVVVYCVSIKVAIYSLHRIHIIISMGGERKGLPGCHEP